MMARRKTMTAQELQDARKRMGLTVPQLARALGYSQRTVEGWLSGEREIRIAIAAAVRSMEGK